MKTQTLEISEPLDCDISFTNASKMLEDVMKCGDYFEIGDPQESNIRSTTACSFCIDIGQFPRDTGECFEDADELEEVVSTFQDSGRCESEIFCLSGPFDPGTHQSINASAPYRVLITGGLTLPEYCDDESDGNFYGLVAIIYDSDQAAIDKLREDFRFHAANAVVDNLLKDTQSIQDALKGCSYPKLIEAGKVLRAYGQVYAERIARETANDDQSDISTDDQPSVSHITGRASNDNNPLPSIQQVLQAANIPAGQTLYYPGEDYKEALKGAYDFVSSAVHDAGLNLELKSVWGIGGAEPAEALLVSKSMPGCRIVIGGKDVEIQLAGTKTVSFESETEQIMASVDPSSFLHSLLGEVQANAVLDLCKRLALTLQTPDITPHVNVNRLKLCQTS